LTYSFDGFFARPAIRRPASIPLKVNWRQIVTPFVGIGLRLPDSDDGFDDRPPPAIIQNLAREFGLNNADSWIYLNYICWGGRIDSVYGLGACHGIPFGPVAESDGDQVERAYVSLMTQFGVSADNALHFEPFIRGFWDDE